MKQQVNEWGKLRLSLMDSDPNTDQIDLSIVTTLYNSQDFINEFYSRILPQAEGITHDFEIIFVNDGSPDNSSEIVKKLIALDNRVVLIELSKNFGHHKAIVAGLKYARGKTVFLIDVDLEEKPEYLSDFFKTFTNTNADVVYGFQDTRAGGLFKKFSGNLFYKLFNLLSYIKIPENPCTMRLMNRKYVDSLLMLHEKNLYLAGDFSWCGYNQVAVPIQKTVRNSKSNYSFLKSVKMLVDAITSFSSYPLVIVFNIGCIIIFISLLFGAGLLIEKFIHPETILIGYTSMMISLWLIGGLVIFSIGLIGIYLSKIFIEVQDRPLFLIKKITKR